MFTSHRRSSKGVIGPTPQASSKTKLGPHQLLLTVNDPFVENDDAWYHIAIMDPLRPRLALHVVKRNYAQLQAVMKRLQALVRTDTKKGAESSTGANHRGAATKPDGAARADPQCPNSGLTGSLEEVVFPTVPRTKVFGALEMPFLEARRAAIEEYINFVSAHPTLCYDTAFLEYIGYTAAAHERMVRVATVMEIHKMPTLRACVRLLETTGAADNFCSGSNETQVLSSVRCWLRAHADYTFVRLLPSLTHPRWPQRKAYVLVRNYLTQPCLLSVQPIREEVAAIRLAEPAVEKDAPEGDASAQELADRIRRLRTMVARLDPTVFAPATTIDVTPEGYLICVRPLYPSGSLSDYLYKVDDPIASGAAKFPKAEAFMRRGKRGDNHYDPEGDAKPLKLAELQSISRALLRIVCVCHDFDLRTPNLTLGNLLVVRDQTTGLPTVQLSGIEDILAGNSWLPMLPALEDEDEKDAEDGSEPRTRHTRTEIDTSEGQPLASMAALQRDAEAPTRTHIDLLLLAGVIFQCATGRVLTPHELYRILSVQGDPLVPRRYADRHAIGDGIDIATQTHVLAPSILREMPPEVANVLHYLLHPSIPADLRVLIHQQFLRPAGVHSVAVVVPAGEARCVPLANAGPGPTDDEAVVLYSAPGEMRMSIKKRDLELLQDCQELWASMWSRKLEGLEKARRSNGPQQNKAQTPSSVEAAQRRLTQQRECTRVTEPEPVVAAIDSLDLLVDHGEKDVQADQAATGSEAGDVEMNDQPPPCPALGLPPDVSPSSLPSQPPPMDMSPAHASPSTEAGNFDVPPPPLMRPPPPPPEDIEQAVPLPASAESPPPTW